MIDFCFFVADSLGFLATIEDDERLAVVLTCDVLHPSNRDEFGRDLTAIEHGVSADLFQFATLAPYDAVGQPVRVRMAADATNLKFWFWLTEQRCASFATVENMYYTSDVSVGERTKRSRVLRSLYMHGAVLVCVGARSRDIDDFGISAQWYVCGTDDAHECSLAIALELAKSLHVDRMNVCIAKRLLMPVLNVAFEYGVIKNLDRTIGQMQVLLLASNAKSIICDMGWQHERLDCLLMILQDIFWSTRPDLSEIDAASLSIAALCLFEPVRRRAYERKSDMAIESLRRYYLGDADVMTESNRRSTTQRLNNTRATLAGARAVVFVETGVSLSRSTICRLLAPRRIDSIEAGKYRTVFDLRPLMPRKGDIDDKLDAHYALALLRYIRETIGNLAPRHNTTRTAIIDAILISRDDKARIFLDGGTPTARPYPQMHLVARDVDGHVLPPAATLPTVEFGKVANNSVICHTMLVSSILRCAKDFYNRLC